MDISLYNQRCQTLADLADRALALEGLDGGSHDDLIRIRHDILANHYRITLLGSFQSGKSTIPVFERLLTTLGERPWALVLNCGRAGPHLEDPQSPAAEQVEAFCTQQLCRAGPPHFVHRLDAVQLPSLLLRGHACNTLDIAYAEALASVQTLRRLLLALGHFGLRIHLDAFTGTQLPAHSQLNGLNSGSRSRDHLG